MLIHSIYLATEGEGIFIGRPQIFVRFQGCKVGCRNCDSKETWPFKGQRRSLMAVMEEIKRISPIKVVSITGGDPLDPQNLEGVLVLSKELKSQGYFINLEAAGNVIVPEIFQLVDFISMDYKTPTTGVKTSLDILREMKVYYPGKFQVKSVIQSQEDFDDALSARNSMEVDFPWCLTPAYNTLEAFPRERFVQILEMNESLGGPFRVIGQQHKWVYGPDKRNK